MRRPIITEEIYSGRCLPLKTIDFTGDQMFSARNAATRGSKQRAESGRVKTTGIGKNIEIVMKLSEIYSTPTEFFQSISSNLTKSQPLSPNKKSQTSVSPARRILLKSALLKQTKKQMQSHINFSPVKLNNYKFFPKRQVKLKNNNPYKFYMFNQKSQYSARLPRENSGQKEIRIHNICTFVKDPNPNRKKMVSLEIRSNRETIIEPWANAKDQGKDDSILF